MLNLEQVRELRRFNDNNAGTRDDLLDTLEAALRVVEAAKTFHDRYKEWNDGKAYEPLAVALHPFTAKTGEA